MLNIFRCRCIENWRSHCRKRITCVFPYVIILCNLSGEELLCHTIKPEDGDKNHQWHKVQTQRKPTRENSRQRIGKTYAVSQALTLQKSELGLRAGGCTICGTPAEGCGPQITLQIYRKVWSREENSWQSSTDTKGSPGKWACSKGVCQELSHRCWGREPND